MWKPAKYSLLCTDVHLTPPLCPLSMSVYSLYAKREQLTLSTPSTNILTNSHQMSPISLSLTHENIRNRSHGITSVSIKTIRGEINLPVRYRFVGVNLNVTYRQEGTILYNVAVHLFFDRRILVLAAHEDLPAKLIFYLISKL